MSSQTTRVVPHTNLMTEDSERRPEGIACDLPSDEAERLVSLGLATKVLKSEVPAGAPVEVVRPASTDAAPDAVPVEPERIQVEAPPAETGRSKARP